MSDGHQTNAMTEIALALAMAFFSIMVLTMISMGAGMNGPQGARQSLSMKDGITVRPEISRARSASNDIGRSAKSTPYDSIVIYYAGRFLDAGLKETNPSSLGDGGPLILAVDPKLTMTEATQVRQRIHIRNVTVTTLDQRWLNALKERRK